MQKEVEVEKLFYLEENESCTDVIIKPENDLILQTKIELLMKD